MAKIKLRRSNATILGLLLVLIMGIAAAVLITNQVVAFQRFPFDFDEANHVNGALALYMELGAQDLEGFAAEFMSQGFYPPGFSWLKAIAFLLFGSTSIVARVFSVLMLFLSLLVIYAVPLEIDQEFGWLAGVTAVALTLTIQPLLVNSAMVMMEAPGLLASFAMIWLYLRAIKAPTRARLLGVGVLLILTFFTKYTYGLIAVATIGLMELSLVIAAAFGTEVPDKAGPETGATGEQNAGGKSLPEIVRRWLWLFGPFIAALLAWFILADNAQGFFAYATAQPPDQAWITWDNLSIYPRSFINQFVPSPLFALFSVAGLIWGLWKWRDPLIRVLVIYFVVGALIMTINLPKNPRFIATFVPALHILTGLMLGDAAAHLNSNRRPASLAAIGLIIFMFLGALASLPTLFERYAAFPSLMEVEYETSPQSNDIVDWIEEQIPEGGRFFVLNYWDQLSPQRIAWQLWVDGSGDSRGTDFDELLMPSALVAEATPDNISRLRQEILQSDVDHVVLFEGGAWGLPFWPEYAEAMGDVLEPLARENFEVSYFDTEGWQDTELLTRTEWNDVKEDSRYTLDIDVIIYRVNPVE